MKKIIFVAFLAFCAISTTPSFVHAKRTVGDAEILLGDTLRPTGLSDADVSTTAGRLISGALTSVGILFLALMVYGGFLWMTARGEETQITKAKDTIIAAIIGLVVILGAYGLTQFITERFTKDVKPSPTSPSSGGTQDAIGCCHDKTGEFTWSCRLDTESQCETQGTNGSDRYSGRDDWRWSPTETTRAACVASCE